MSSFEGKNPDRASNLGTGFVGIAFPMTPIATVFSMKDPHPGYNRAVSLVGILVLVALTMGRPDRSEAAE